MAPTTILTLVGSLRSASVNRRLAVLAAETAPDEVRLDIYEDLAGVPFYNEDLDTDEPPSAVAALRAAAAQAAGALFVTPENNGTIPAVLKNAIDWLSRPWGAGALNGKPVAVIGFALGRSGGSAAHDETRKSLGIAGPRVLDTVTLSLSGRDLNGQEPAEHAATVDAVRAAVLELVTDIASTRDASA